jgi:type IV secretion system protein TrbL
MKLVNLFVSYFFKVMIMCMCLFWVFAEYLNLANDMMVNVKTDGFLVLAQVIYTCILGLVMTQNAPQIASALISGNPSLSMGEFINAAKSFGTGAVAGALASYGANQAKKVAGGAKNLHAAGKAAEGAAQKFNSGAANLGQTLSTAGGIASAGKENGGGAGKAASFLKDSFNGAFGNHVQSKLTGQKSGESGKLSHQSTGGKGGWARDPNTGKIKEDGGQKIWDPNYNRAQSNHGVNGTQTSADIRQHQQEMREHAVYGDTMNVPKAPESGGSKQNTPLSDEGAVSNREKTGGTDDPGR